MHNSLYVCVRGVRPHLERYKETHCTFAYTTRLPQMFTQPRKVLQQSSKSNKLKITAEKLENYKQVGNKDSAAKLGNKKGENWKVHYTNFQAKWSLKLERRANLFRAVVVALKQGRLQVNSVTRAHRDATIRGLRHWNFHFLSFWEALSVLCRVFYVTRSEKFSRELVHCCVTYVTEQCWLVLINPSYWTIYRSFEIIFEWYLCTGLEFKSNVSMQNHCFNKTFNLAWTIFHKILNCRRQLGL